MRGTRDDNTFYYHIGCKTVLPCVCFYKKFFSYMSMSLTEVKNPITYKLAVVYQQ